MQLAIRTINPVFLILFCLQAPWEMISLVQRPIWCAQCYESDLLYFLLYNTGDINNSGGLSFLLLFLVDRISTHDRINRIVACTITILIFLFLERNDLMDMPFAILGAVFILFPALVHPLKSQKTLAR